MSQFEHCLPLQKPVGLSISGAQGASMPYTQSRLSAFLYLAILSTSFNRLWNRYITLIKLLSTKKLRTLLERCSLTSRPPINLTRCILCKYFPPSVAHVCHGHSSVHRATQNVTLYSGSSFYITEKTNPTRIEHHVITVLMRMFQLHELLMRRSDLW